MFGSLAIFVELGCDLMSCDDGAKVWMLVGGAWQSRSRRWMESAEKSTKNCQ